MPARSYARGRRYEYLLCEILRRMEYFVIRAPGSGGGRRRDPVPDIIGIRKGRVVGVEVKMRGDNRDIYIEKERYEALLGLQEKYGIEIYLCVYYPLIKGFRCVEINKYSYITGEYVVYAREDVLTRGVPPDRLIHYGEGI